MGQAPEAPHYARVMFSRLQLSSHLANHRFRLQAKLTITPLIAGCFCAIFALNPQQVISFALVTIAACEQGDAMNVFISWSGNRSKAVATFLRKWIPDIIQAAKPWMSGEDIAAGARWSDQVQKQLEDSKFGIICLTKDNLNAPWIHFETGALAKTVEDTFVCPYLIGLEPSEIPDGPLTQFQAKRANRQETLDIISSMNEAMRDAALPKEQLQRQFERCWRELDKALNDLPPVGADEGQPDRGQESMVAEILEIVRGLSRWTSAQDTKAAYESVVQKILKSPTLPGGLRGLASRWSLESDPLWKELCDLGQDKEAESRREADEEERDAL